MAVCTCLIVVAVASATVTPKAILSAIKTNFGPMVWPPISISTRPAYGQPVRRFKARGERDQRTGSRFPAGYSPRSYSASPREVFRTELSIRTSFQLENVSFKWKTPHSTLTVHEPDPRAAVHCAEPIQKFCEINRNRCHATELFRSCQMAWGSVSDDRYLIA